MIAQLRGTIVHSVDQQAVLDVQGVGYAVHVSGRTQGQIATMSGEVTLLTEMQVREDSMTLFGFLDLGERDAFRLLITVQGVGAKAAMAILSVLAPHDLTTAIIAGDKAMVARADGVGPKIAQRVVNELGEKIGKISSLGGALAIGDAGGGAGGLSGVGAGAAASGLFLDAVSALVNLGYGRAEAHGAVMRVQANAASDNLSDVIAAALREMGT
ncbi:MAG: Holliday junction branch migration protein RuvA [Alphaproteobacteria bacterium]|nr:Holliday junction branch migration protein RuvA [Alphaproteobacteria bacterium]NDA18252.1 Holliday junction branch migration protein RuvA [Alphaproteobacteria bacterium]NDG37054.1 Holliday junction branch migration protein RuvA [Alphaproteobacteria bacterium]